VLAIEPLLIGFDRGLTPRSRPWDSARRGGGSAGNQPGSVGLSGQALTTAPACALRTIGAAHFAAAARLDTTRATRKAAWSGSSLPPPPRTALSAW